MFRRTQRAQRASRAPAPTGSTGARVVKGSGPINTSRAEQLDFAPDPVGTGMFLGLSGVHQLGVEGRDGYVMAGDHGQGGSAFNGDLGHDLQHMTGQAALALSGAAKPIPTGKSATFENSRDNLNDLPDRIFAARARRKGVRP